MAGGPDQLAADLAAVALHLKEAGEGGLARELSRRVNKAIEPLPDAIRKGLDPHLPDPYATVLSDDLRLARRNKVTADGWEATLTATTPGIRRRINRLDDGILWHPTYGSRRHGRYQDVRKGWFTGPAEDMHPAVREAIRQGLEEIIRKAARK